MFYVQFVFLILSSLLFGLFAFDATKLPAEARRWSAWGFDADGAATVMEITVIE